MSVDVKVGSPNLSSSVIAVNTANCSFSDFIHQGELVFESALIAAIVLFPK